MTDGDGGLLAEIDYTDYGEPVFMPIVAVVDTSLIAANDYDPANGTTLLTGIGAPGWTGREIRIARHADNVDRYISFEVMRSGGGETLVRDPGGDISAAIDELTTQSTTPAVGGGPVVYDNPNGLRGGVWAGVVYDAGPDRTRLLAADYAFSADYIGAYIHVNIAGAGTYQVIDWDDQSTELHFTGDLTSAVAAGDAWYAPELATVSNQQPANSGAWRAAPAYSAGFTTFTAEPLVQFADFHAGWLMLPDVDKQAYVRVAGVSGNTQTVAGDVSGLAAAGARFRLVAPVGADRATGEAPPDVWAGASRWLWAGYMYEPAMHGHLNSLGTETIHRAPGPDNDPDTHDDNKAGTYYCWNRTYDIRTGRWTTPDPASQYANSQSYVGLNPLSNTDPSGLETKWVSENDGSDTVKRQYRRLPPSGRAADPWTLTGKSVRTGKLDGGIDLTLTNCECCYAGSIGWLKDMLNSAYRIVLKAHKAATALKAARDRGVRGDTMGFSAGSDERLLLTLFKWDEVNAGDTATTFIKKLHANLSAMKERLENKGWDIECTREGRTGNAASVALVLPSTIHINCEHPLNRTKSNNGLVASLLNELSHVAFGAKDRDGFGMLGLWKGIGWGRAPNVAKGEHVDLSDLYDDLAQTYSSEIQTSHGEPGEAKCR